MTGVGSGEREADSRCLPPLLPLGLHEARHTYVSLLAAAGTALEEAGDSIGPSSAYMTDRYRHLIEEAARAGG